MSSRNATPRHLIQGVLSTNTVSKSAVKFPRTHRRRSLRASLSTATPGTLIRGVLQTASTAKKSPAKRSRVRQTPPPSSVRRSARKRQRRSVGPAPTPRGLIHGYLTSTVPETPAVRKADGKLSGTPTEKETDFENYQGRIADLISPDADTPDLQSQINRTGPSTRRQRRQADSVKDAFESGLERRLQDDASKSFVPSFSDSSAHLESISEEGEAPGAANTEEEEEDRDADYESNQDDAIENLATQPPRAGIVTKESMHDTHKDSESEEVAEMPDTDETSSQTSLGEVAEANTIQAHSGDPAEVLIANIGLDDETTDQDGSESAAKDEPAVDSGSALPQPPSKSRQNASNLQFVSLQSELSDSQEEDAVSSRLQNRVGTESPPELRNIESDIAAERIGGEVQQVTGQREGSLLEQGSSSPQEVDLFNEESDIQDISVGFSPLNTPAVVSSQRRPTPLAKTPALLRRTRRDSETAPPAAKKRKRAPRQKAQRRRSVLPLSLTKSIFKHFYNGRVSRDAWEAIDDCCETFFSRISSDLAHYSKHAGRQTVLPEDVVLLMKRQGLVKDTQSLYALIEKYLTMEYRRELIPCAQAVGGAKPDVL